MASGILGGAYRFLDPILPFDQQLDPRFGDGSRPGGILGGMQQPQQAPQAAPGPAPGTAGPPPMAAPQGPQGGPQMGEKPYRPSLVDTLWGVAAGYSPGAARRMLTDDDAARKAAAAERQRSMGIRDQQMQFAETLDPRQRAIFLANPAKWAEESAVSYRPQIAAPGSSAYVNNEFKQAPLAPIEVTAGSAVYDPNSRQELYRAPIKPEIVTTSPGQTATLVNPGGGSGGTPRGVRNNNPGNIEDGPFAKSLPGYKGSDGRFAIFETPQAGQGAQVALLQSYGKRGINTVEAIINRWAPPSDNNPTPTYVSFVARKLGIDPKQPLDLSRPEVAGALANAIAEFENGQGGSTGPTSQVVAQGGAKPQWQVDPTGQFQIGPDGKREAIPRPSMPVALQKAEDTDLEAISTASGINSLLSSYAQQIDSGALKLGPVANLIASGRLAIGQGDENARNFGSFKAGLERLRNESLRLNSGVQTDGDAQRAWNELMSNINDEGFVKQRLQEIQRLNERAVQLRQALVAQRRQRSGLPAMEDFGAFTAPAGSPASAKPAPATKPKPVKKDPFPNIREGQVVMQGGKSYRRQGNQMVEVR